MIAQAKSIPHGEAMTNYATKNLRADIVKTNLLSEGLPPMGMWDEMVLHQSRSKHLYARKPVKNTSIRIEASPSEDESKDWKLDDWARYATRLIGEMNRTTEVMHKGRPQKVKPIDMTKCQYFAALHKDSKSGIPHLHLVVNRFDCDGKLINDSFIGDRAVAAAAVINREMGWRDPMEIRREHLKEIEQACQEVLREMSSFSWLVYKMELKKRGYDVKFRRDKGVICGYSVKRGHSNYRASDIGSGRKYTASKIENTHRLLHHIDRAAAAQSRFSQPRPQAPRPAVQTYGGVGNGRSMHGTTVAPKPVQPQTPSFFSKVLEVDGHAYSIRMSPEAHKAMSDEIVVPDSNVPSHEQVLNVAMLLFMGYLDAATTVAESYGGGGSTSNDKKRDDEDDKAWARRCAAKANWLCKPMRRSYKR